MASDLKKELLELLERDREFRLSVAGLLGYKEILEELKRLREDMHRGFEEHSRRFDENDRKFNEILERLDRHEEEIKALREDFLNFQRRLDAFQRSMDSFEETQKAFQRRLDALGARWGLLSEDAFRGSMWGIVERLFGGSVEHWIYEDSEGFVFGYPATIEVDLIIKDKEHILVEIKSHVRKSDVGVLLRKGKLYKKVKGITPRLVFVSPYIDEDARNDAEMLGIETYNA